MLSMKHHLAITLCLAICCVTTNAQDSEVNKIRTVVLDAGHGGKDPGNLGTKTLKKTEKDVTLAVTKMLGKQINEQFPDVKVIYTRESDVFIGLKERTRIANDAKADLFISIHCNASDNSKAMGADTWVMGLHKTQSNLKTAQRENSTILLEEGHEIKYEGFDPTSPESMIMLTIRQNAFLDQSLTIASKVQNEFKTKVERKDRGVKQAGFYVISYTTMPSILIELGFLTNSEEEKFLQSDDGQLKMANAVFRAFSSYKEQIEGVPTQVGSSAAPPVASSNDGDVEFRVQIATASKPVTLKAKNFRGLEGVEEYTEKGLYKYTYGKAKSMNKAREHLAVCQKEGFEQAFIVAFRNGERIGLQEAFKLAQAP